MACRYAFYCAQSYKDAGIKYIDESIEWYIKVLGLGNWEQEKYYSCLMLGGLYAHKNDMVNAVKYWFDSCNYDNERIECIILAMNYLRSTSQHMFVNSLYHRFKGYKRSHELRGKLFVLDSNFNDELEYHNSISAFYVGDKMSGYTCCKQIIINNVISYPLLKSIMSNILFYKDQFYLIDANPTDINSIEFDANKLRQDLDCLWFVRNQNKNLTYKIVCDKISNHLKNKWEFMRNDYILIFMLIRILPYCSDEFTKQFLITEINKLWQS